MSRSHSYRANHSYDDRSREESSISVTQASFQNLGLHETVGTHRSSSSSLRGQDQRSPRSVYRRAEPPSSYLQTAYNTGGYDPAPPSEAYIDPQRLSSNYIPSASENQDYLNPSSTTLSRANMGYSSYAGDSYRAASPYISSRSPTASAYTYTGAEPSHQRSMSGFPGPIVLPSSTSGPVGPHELEIVRQRRRDLHEARRSNKLRARRALPSISEAGSSTAPDMSHSIDFVVAPPTTSSYEMPGHFDPYRGAVPSSTYVTGPSNTSLYPNYPYPQQPYSSIPSSTSQSPRSATSQRGSTAPSPSGEQAIRVVGEPRSRPQCWDHGCNGRQFSTFSNLLRHQREKSGLAAKSTCPRCGAEFTRTTARNGHVAEGKCTRSDRRKSPHDR